MQQMHRIHHVGFPQVTRRPVSSRRKGVDADPMERIDRLLIDQSGVVARRQLFEAGLRAHDVARAVRRRDLNPLLRGVYLHHTGPPTWHQRSWAAVLYAWPAALTHGSSLRAAEGPGRRELDQSLIEVLVDSRRHLMGQPGLRIIRSRGFDQRVQWNAGPPRTRYEDATLDVAAESRDRTAIIAALSAACGGRRTTAARLLTCAEGRSRLPDREWITEVLADVASGTCSVLEHGYLHRVQRAHALPEGARQVSHRHGSFSGYSDVEHDEYGLIVELDGRIWHSTAAARDADLDRDLSSAAVDDAQTLRLGYRQVFDQPCRTASQVGAVLARRGWSGPVRRCPLCAEQRVA